ncbi:riboflavin synthase [Geodermatophilus sp. DSM 44513]|uniref:riboflavin synthase n=1 Tax=Geodermatophilus sp. DSM 44513 TaxID=1528104 RepID=UPI00127CB36E|nr:riboflavin synthase [Geodermatophilus sp. DSM 44513]WNV77501.1 riboflavin synthase [Geodermatophilus sp. DSM 44513]
MFTGIVEEVGVLLAREEQQDSARLRIRARTALEGVALGDSIAVNGVCLTVTSADGEEWTTDVMAETLRRSSIGALGPGDPVNLERAVTPQTRLGGHLVQGHVDGVGTVLTRTPGDQWEVVRIALPPELARYVVEKGSITLDGVSLTVSAVSDIGTGGEGAGTADAEPWFEVSLIPTTLRETTLGAVPPGSPVNLEVDVIAKYVERLLEARR